MISIFRFVTGPTDTNTYLVADEKSRGLIIDPSTGCRELLRKVAKDSITVEAIVLTHAHFDHIMGIPEIQREIGELPVYVHPKDAPFLASPELNGSMLIGEEYDFSEETKDLCEGVFRIGSFTLTVLHVPGHTPGGCALLIDSHCFCGDSVFAGSIGRSDLPGGNSEDLIGSIKTRLLSLPDSTTLYPGHGGRTTIAREKRNNPFLQ